MAANQPTSCMFCFVGQSVVVGAEMFRSGISSLAYCGGGWLVSHPLSGYSFRPITKQKLRCNGQSETLLFLDSVVAKVHRLIALVGKGIFCKTKYRAFECMYKQRIIDAKLDTTGAGGDPLSQY